jgi:DNA invertase Pin-like site-specific DNA recombinase
MDKPAIPAAQYLRMSTENQQYSLHNQSDAITRYAAEHGFSVVTTYTDAAKSGLRLKNRFGLRRLLKDVVDGGIEFRAVLVYDVSRWGRFQDTDESAHYEYLCKSAGIPVHYCAEQFLNDNSMGGFIFKALKRSMAAEYSRELSVRVRAGSLRHARLW